MYLNIRHDVYDSIDLVLPWCHLPGQPGVISIGQGVQDILSQYAICVQLMPHHVVAEEAGHQWFHLLTTHQMVQECCNHLIFVYLS